MILVNTTNTKQFLSADIIETNPQCFWDQKSSKGQLQDFLHSEAYFKSFNFLEIRMCFIIVVYKCSVQIWLLLSSHVNLLLNQWCAIQCIAS